MRIRSRQINYKYHDLERFSRDIGISKENLVKAFEVEREFHSRILKEPDRKLRKRMYNEVYNRVHPIYAKSSANDTAKNLKDKIVKLFREELEGKSILDVGCGQGQFLLSVASQLDHKRLVGIDTSISVIPKRETSIEFIKGDIVEFDLNYKFEVIFSCHVLEHIGPSDLPIHLSSIRNALSEHGEFILIMPNRLFGPSDVTRIIDYTYTNRTISMGTHLNESTYTEMIPMLAEQGFSKFWTVLPIPLIMYYFPKIRMTPNIMIFIENNATIMNLLYRIRIGSKCIAKFPVILICE